MVCAPVRSIIPSLKLGDYLSVQAHKPCSISHLFYSIFSMAAAAEMMASVNIVKQPWWGGYRYAVSCRRIVL